jgi:tetratricopeptide (TPR) repeat protein
LRELLGVEPSAEVPREPNLPTSSKAARLYAEGLERLRLFDALGARDRLQAAVEEAPEAALVHAALAAAWTALGYDAEAAAAARQAFELGEGLPRSEHMLVEARYHETAGSRARAVEIYSALHEYYPDDLEHGLRLVRVLSSYGRGREAADALESLHRLPPPAGEDPRIDLAEAEVAELLSDYPRSLAAARRALERSEALGARWLKARAGYQEGRAYWRLGEWDEAILAAQTAEALFEALGDREGLARALNLRANVAQNEGHAQEARALYEEALAHYRDIGQQAGVSRVLNNLAWVVYQEGEVEKARALYREAIAIARRVESLSDEARGLHNLALLSKQEGDFSGAQTLYNQSLDLARESGDRGLESLVLNNLARLLQERGALEEAVETFEQGLEIARQIGDVRGAASRSSNLGILLRQLGRPTEAAEHFRESIDIYRRLENTERLVRRLNNLARLERERGNLAAARSACHEVEELLPALGETPERAVWSSLYAWVLAAEGDLDGALERIEESLTKRRREGSEESVLVAEVDRARMFLVLDRPAEAQAQARRARDRLLEIGDPADAVVASAILLRALIRQGAVEKAAVELQEVREILGGAGPVDTVVRLRLEAIALELRTLEDPAAAVDGLEALRERIEATGFGELAFEVRLALGDALTRADRAAAAGEVLGALARDAEAAGFREIARRARALRTP